MKNWQRTLWMISTLIICLLYLLWPKLSRADTETSSQLALLSPSSQANDAGVFLPVLDNVGHPSIAVDQAGGIHLAFEAVSKARDGTAPIQYGYCARNCLLETNWQIIRIGDAGLAADSEVRLALTATGKPRLLWFYTTDSDLDGSYIFASCDQNCTQPTNWQGLSVADVQGGPTRGRYFALDAQGNPHFLYTSILDDHTGAFYRYCLRSCLSPQSWHEQKINDNFQWSAFSLAFDARNRLRLALSIEKNYRNTLVYVTCEIECTSTANWQPVGLMGLGVDRNLSLRLDAEGHPRLAVYTGNTDDSRTKNRLHYLWCNSNCQQVSNWRGVNLELAEFEGGNMDLLLDAQARPHLVVSEAYLPSQIDYIYCSSQCDIAPVWQHDVVETAEQVAGTDLWYIGIRPALAWALTGDLLMIYGVEHKLMGTDDSTNSIRLVGARRIQATNPSSNRSPTFTATPTPFK